MGEITSLATDERTARIVMACIAEPGDDVTGRLLVRFGAVETLPLVTSDATLPGRSKVESGLWRTRLAARADAATIRSAIEAGKRVDAQVLIPGDDAWPTGVMDLGDRAPYALWVRGDTGLLTAPVPGLVTVTGARAATSYGEHVGSALAGELATQGRIVVAGAAYGIDGAAHRAALTVDRPTVAVLAGGVDRPYPSGHRELLDRIALSGAVISALPAGAAPTRWRFIQRGHLMAALSGATVIVEAGYRSGSLEVARQAKQICRPVGAVPGPVTSVASGGAHRLFQEGLARVVTDAADILALLEPGRADSSARTAVRDRSLPERVVPARSGRARERHL